MRRVLLAIFFICYFSPANAQDCPDFYRFVDFGIEAHDGKIYRGGTVLRAEGFNGQALLLTEKTQCRSIQDVAKDGHGNPIPVVTSVNYDPKATGMDLNELKVSVVKDTTLTATKNSVAHQTKLTNSKVNVTQGSNFLCANDAELSCQLISPYPGNIPLVVYCDETRCKMPVLAINEQLQISAAWSSKKEYLSDPSTATAEISSKVQQIHDFIKPLSASL